MEILIIILIVAIIVQTCAFTYANFIDTANKRESAANAETVRTAQHRFIQDTEEYRNNLRIKDEVLKQWIGKYNSCARERDEARIVNGLLKQRTAYIEGLKDSFNQQAEHEWQGRGFIEQGANAERLRFVEGMKAGAEWVAKCVGVDVEFEIDERHR